MFIRFLVDFLSESQFHVQWTLLYPATMGPDHGEISEIAGYVNHRANSVYNEHCRSLSCHVIHCQYKLLSYFGLSKLQTIEIPAFLHGYSSL